MRRWDFADQNQEIDRTEKQEVGNLTNCENRGEMPANKNGGMRRHARWWMAMFLVLSLGIFTACGGNGQSSSEASSEVVEATSEESVEAVSSSVEASVSSEEVSSEESSEVVEEPKGPTSPLNGLEATEEQLNRRVVAVSIDNEEPARWQSGLDKAEIVYEYKIEGASTRYLAMYLIEDPEMIGPIRSARPYFVDRVMEWDAIFAHVGGSGDGLQDIKDYGIASIDGTKMDYPYFENWDVGKRRPHVHYTTAADIREKARRFEYRNDPPKQGYQFSETPMTAGENATEVKFKFFNTETSGFVYDASTGLYERYKDGELQLEEQTGKPLQVANVIGQYASQNIYDGLHRHYDHVGTGEGVLIRDGKYVPITWEKKDRKSLTRYYNLDGTEIVLKPGQTWVQMIDDADDFTVVR